MSKVLSFSMFSKAGDRAMTGLFNRTVRKIHGKQRVTKKDIEKYVKAGIHRIADRYVEVYDSEPPRIMADRLEIELEKAGYNFEVDHYEFY